MITNLHYILSFLLLISLFVYCISLFSPINSKLFGLGIVIVGLNQLAILLIHQTARFYNLSLNGLYTNNDDWHSATSNIVIVTIGIFIFHLVIYTIKKNLACKLET